METNRRTWNAAVKLAVVLSALAALVAVVASLLGDIPEAAIVIPVIVIAFAASWVQTGRVRQDELADIIIPRPVDRVA